MGGGAGVGFAHELEALLDAEAVLLVDDDEAKIGEVYVVFYESVGADGEVDFAAEDPISCVAFRSVVEAPGEESDAIGAAGARRDFFAEEFAGGEVVLRGEDFGGCHEGDLIAVFYRD